MFKSTGDRYYPYRSILFSILFSPAINEIPSKYHLSVQNKIVQGYRSNPSLSDQEFTCQYFLQYITYSTFKMNDVMYHEYSNLVAPSHDRNVSTSFLRKNLATRKVQEAEKKRCVRRARRQTYEAESVVSRTVKFYNLTCGETSWNRLPPRQPALPILTHATYEVSDFAQ